MPPGYIQAIHPVVAFREEERSKSKGDRPLIGYAILAAAVVTVLSLPFQPSMDGQVRFDSLQELLTKGTWTEIRYSLYGPLVSSPLWFLGNWCGEPGCVLSFNRIIFVCSLLALGRLLRGVLEERELVRFLIVLAAASMFPHYTMNYMGEVFTAIAVGVGLAAVTVRRAWWGWPLMLLGAANTPATIPALGCALLVLCWHRRRLRYILAVGLAAGMVLAENYLRRGHPLSAGYDRDRALFPNVLPYSGQEGFCYPIMFGLLSVLFSFGKGLIFYVPALFLRYPAEPEALTDDRAARMLYRVWLAFVIGLVLVYCRWWCWSGSWCWGPRFFLFAGLPAALVLARWASRPPAGLWTKALLLLVIAESAWVGGCGMVFYDYGLSRFSENYGELDFAAFYVPECSALWWPYTYPDQIRPFSWFDWARLGISVITALYLAIPIVPLFFRQGWKAVESGWAAIMSGPRFRF